MNQNNYLKLNLSINFAKEQQLYQDIFGNIVIEIKNKGYKDYGLDGTMRNYAQGEHDQVDDICVIGISV